MAIEAAFGSSVQDFVVERGGPAVENAKDGHCVPVREKMHIVSSALLCNT